MYTRDITAAILFSPPTLAFTHGLAYRPRLLSFLVLAATLNFFRRVHLCLVFCKDLLGRLSRELLPTPLAIFLCAFSFQQLLILLSLLLLRLLEELGLFLFFAPLRLEEAALRSLCLPLLCA
jgi:hypothetical protein